MNSSLKKSIKIAKAANDLTDPTVPFSSFMKYNKNDLDITMDFIKAPSMTSALKEEIFSLMKDNMIEVYKKSPWGWNEKKKRKELFHIDARYIVARNSADKSLAAFVHFRFDIEDTVEVLYVYEIQVEQKVRNKGLGHYLMTLMETITFHYKMQRIVLTVLKSEMKVVRFYFSLHYKIASYNPRDAFYCILSKNCKTLELDNN